MNLMISKWLPNVCIKRPSRESVSVVVSAASDEPLPTGDSLLPLATGLLVCIVIIYFLCFWMELW